MRIVKLSQTSGAPFQADKNGNYPFILTPMDGQGKLTVGGLMNGSIAKRAGLKNGSIISVQVSSEKAFDADGNPIMITTGEQAGKQAINVRHDVVADLTEAFSSEVAKHMVANIFGGMMQAPAAQSVATPIAEVEPVFGAEETPA